VNPGPRFSAQLVAAAAGVLPLRMRRGGFTAAGLSQLGWALGVLRVRVDDAWLAAWRDAVTRQLQVLLAASTRLRRAAGGSSGGSSGGGSGGGSDGSSDGSAETVSPQSLAMLLWATARLTEHHHALVLPLAAGGAGAGAGAGASGEQQQQQQQPAAAPPSTSPPAPSAAAAAAAAATAAAAAERAHLVWFAGVERALWAQLHAHSPQSLSMCLWALGKMGYRPNDTLLGERAVRWPALAAAGCGWWLPQPRSHTAHARHAACGLPPLLRCAPHQHTHPACTTTTAAHRPPPPPTTRSRGAEVHQATAGARRDRARPGRTAVQPGGDAVHPEPRIHGRAWRRTVAPAQEAECARGVKHAVGARKARAAASGRQAAALPAGAAAAQHAGAWSGRTARVRVRHVGVVCLCMCVGAHSVWCALSICWVVCLQPLLRPLAAPP
jgi:hypothetical protein